MSRSFAEFDEIGYWSEIKLEIVRDYASAYSKILTAKKLPHIYIDAFAGAGQHISKNTGEFVPGSPLNALDVRPPFREYHFIDLNAAKVENLQRLAGARRFLSVEPLLEDLGAVDLSGISWVIVGGESGPGARPMKKEWVVSIRRQCEAYRVPFFFKQWGGVRKKKNGRELDGRTYDEYPRRVVASVPDRTRCTAFAESFINSFRGMIGGSALVQIGV